MGVWHEVEARRSENNHRDVKSNERKPSPSTHYTTVVPTLPTRSHVQFLYYLFTQHTHPGNPPPPPIYSTIIPFHPQARNQTHYYIKRNRDLPTTYLGPCNVSSSEPTPEFPGKCCPPQLATAPSFAPDWLAGVWGEASRSF